MGKILGFQSCAKGGEFLDIGVQIKDIHLLKPLQK